MGETVEGPDDRMFFAVAISATGRDSGAPIQQQFWQVYWIADDLVRRRRVFLERDEALEQAGLA